VIYRSAPVGPFTGKQGGCNMRLMKTYIGLVSKDAESAYGVFFPDAPGCFSAADTLDDVFASASEALTGWLATMQEQGLQIPACRDLSDLQKDLNLAANWADAELVIAVPIATTINDAEAA
jgi:predicted RNase H-like HicB family nuclease